MNFLTPIQQQEALNNAIRYFGIPKKYFVNVSGLGKKTSFAIAYKNEDGIIITQTREMTYEELNAYIKGYHKAITNPL